MQKYCRHSIQAEHRCIISTSNHPKNYGEPFLSMTSTIPRPQIQAYLHLPCLLHYLKLGLNFFFFYRATLQQIMLP